MYFTLFHLCLWTRVYSVFHIVSALFVDQALVDLLGDLVVEAAGMRVDEEARAVVQLEASNHKNKVLERFYFHETVGCVLH